MDNGSGERQKIPQRQAAWTHHLKNEKGRHPYSLRSLPVKPQSHRHNDHNGKLPQKRDKHLHHQRTLQVRRLPQQQNPLLRLWPGSRNRKEPHLPENKRSISPAQIRRKNIRPPQRKFPQASDTSPQPLQNSKNAAKWSPRMHHLPPFQSIKRHLVQIPQIHRRPPLFSSRQNVGIKGRFLRQVTV